MSFRTDAYYRIRWPDGHVSVTPLQFLRKGQRITQPAIETRDAMTENETQRIIRRLNAIATALEARAPQRQVRDARPTATREQADAADFEQRAAEWRDYFAGCGPRPELPSAPRRNTYDSRSAREADEFLDGVAKARKQLRERR